MISCQTCGSASFNIEKAEMDTKHFATFIITCEGCLSDWGMVLSVKEPFKAVDPS